jgi:hypothetical protein
MISIHYTLRLNSVFPGDRGTTASERLFVEELGNNHFRLLHSPDMVEGSAVGAEIGLAPSGPYICQ